MPKLYNDIVYDEVLYWFDVLVDNSEKNIAKITKIDKNKVTEVLNKKFNQNVIQ